MLEEIHPLQPFYPKHARVLMLGSFPPPLSRWKMNFYYPNLQNDMWRIMGILFFEDKNHFLTVDRKGFQEDLLRSFLTERGIAISDTARKVIRQKGNASDKFLEIVEKIDLSDALCHLPECTHIVTTGEKAAQTLQSIVAPETKVPNPGENLEVAYGGRKLTVWRMPSSSRAYPKPVEEKASAYAELFRAAGML